MKNIKLGLSKIWNCAVFVAAVWIILVIGACSAVPCKASADLQTAGQIADNTILEIYARPSPLDLKEYQGVQYVVLQGSNGQNITLTTDDYKRLQELLLVLQNHIAAEERTINSYETSQRKKNALVGTTVHRSDSE